MADVTGNARRTGGLSKPRIVEAAITILDADGYDALTFRALAANLATGPGAIYWHVADKDDLLAAATERMVGDAVEAAVSESDARSAVRAVCLGVFDVIRAHPWVGAHLSRTPWQPAILRLLEEVGEHLEALGVPDRSLFDGASAFVHFVLGLASQYAGAARLVPRGTDRHEYLATVAAQWTQLDPASFPFAHRMAAQLPDHDDRDQFLAGVDLILAGLVSTSRR